MDQLAVFLLQVLAGVANLVLISLGLAIIFGMMRVINLAHGEFLMVGGYTVVVATNNGVNMWLAILVLAPLVVGLIGIIVEVVLIRFLYGRMIDTLLATWGLSLLLVGLVTTIFGAQTESTVSPPFGSFSIGDFSMPWYSMFLALMAVLLLVLVYLLLRYTKLGLLARGTMQNAEVAAALGVNPKRIYMLTFGLGAALTGLAGGFLAPIAGVLPTFGAFYIAKAFIAVISGGAAILAGTASAAGLLGAINTSASFLTTPMIGEVALLAAAIVLLRFMPQGITGRFFRRSL